MNINIPQKNESISMLSKLSASFVSQRPAAFSLIPEALVQRISPPDNKQVNYVWRLVFHGVADLSGEKIEAERKYNEQPCSEQERAYVLVIAGKINYSAYAYGKAGKQRPKKNINDPFQNITAF